MFVDRVKGKQSRVGPIPAIVGVTARFGRRLSRKETNANGPKTATASIKGAHGEAALEN